ILSIHLEMAIKHVVGVLLLGLCVTGCGSDNPAAPSPANVAGNWSGTFQYSNNTGSYIVAIAMNLTQAGSSVNGTWSNATRDGTVSGSTTPSNFSGTFTYHTTSTTGGTCTGTFAASGDAGSTTMNWTSPTVTENCTNPPQNITIAVQRR